jgi:hypothetical protein
MLVSSGAILARAQALSHRVVPATFVSDIGANERSAPTPPHRVLLVHPITRLRHRGFRPKDFAGCTLLSYRDAPVFVESLSGKLKTSGSDSLFWRYDKNLINNLHVSV